MISNSEVSTEELASTEINGWFVVVKQLGDERDKTLFADIFSPEFGESRFSFRKVEGQSVEDAIEMMYFNVEKFQLEIAQQQLEALRKHGLKVN